MDILVVRKLWAEKMKADVRMPLIFGDHMVLQQDTKIAIFGWADAGETVEVVFAGRK